MQSGLDRNRDHDNADKRYDDQRNDDFHLAVATVHLPLHLGRRILKYLCILCISSTFTSQTAGLGLEALEVDLVV